MLMYDSQFQELKVGDYVQVIPNHRTRIMCGRVTGYLNINRLYIKIKPLPPNNPYWRADEVSLWPKNITKIDEIEAIAFILKGNS